MKHMFHLRCLLACATLQVSVDASAAVFRVGIGSGCTDANIASALAQAQNNGPEFDIIRINSGTYSAAAIQIGSQSAFVIGGYADCVENTPSGAATVLDGAGNGGIPVVTIFTPGPVRQVMSLQNLTVTGGSAGGVRVFGNVQLDLAGVDIVDNNANAGAGLFVGAANSSESASVQVEGYNGAPGRIEGNSASQGGGIYVGAFAFVALSDVRVTGNTASLGAGVFASGMGSQVGLSTFSSTSPLSGIRGNSASLDGGGVYLQSNASFGSGKFSNESPAPTIADNSAGRNGGGVYFGGPTTYLLGYGLVVRGNTAGAMQNGDGGGLYLTAGTSALFGESGEGGSCGQPQPCAAIENNRAGVDGFSGNGGGVHLLGNANILASHIRIAGNQAQNGAAIHASGSGAAARLSAAVIEHNAGPGHSMHMGAGALLELRGSTLGNDDASQGIIALGGASLLVDTSIIHDPGASILTRIPATTNQVSSRCVLVHAFYDSDVGTVSVGDPLFVAAASGDYALQEASPAIDVCNGEAFSVGETDYGRRQRGQDMMAVPDQLGSHDLGALEYQPEVVFTSSFESS